MGGSTSFNPRSPWEERPVVGVRAPRERWFQSTLPVGGATTQTCRHLHPSPRVSIHAPRGRSDPYPTTRAPDGIGSFNPRSPWEERLPGGRSPVFHSRFQSTLPVGGATPTKNEGRAAPGSFNPRSPWEERQATAVSDGETMRSFNPRSPWEERLDDRQPFTGPLRVSIHAPRGRSDLQS